MGLAFKTLDGAEKACKVIIERREKGDFRKQGGRLSTGSSEETEK